MARKRVLVVDDNTENVESLCELVRLWGFEVEAAQDGKQALAATRARRPDAVIMDLGLPDGDALDVIRRIKAEQHGVAVIAFSGWRDAEAGACAAGADAFVLKPDVEVLERTLVDLGLEPVRAGSKKTDGHC
jgi:CheY-like chemotaxis protein